ncbi:MAG TPA: carboxylesterase family protein [Steroidobacteraceae bacterium]
MVGRRYRTAILLAPLVILAILAGSARAAIEFVDVTGGRLKGEVTNGIASFTGVPFAAPPIGSLRWKAPQAMVAWHGTRNANTLAPACAQPWYEWMRVRISEDCLYLDVWTAAATRKERRPVMVWIHGGGLTQGGSWESVSNGAKLAPEGVVLVSIAYRLGAMGFLAHPDLTRESGKSSGNYGLMDVVAALKWVQANIAQFGGDPTRVTIFGGSSGGVIVSLLAGAPAAKGLYARAIAQGGVAFYPLPTLKEAEGLGNDLLKSLGVVDLKSAREIPAATLNAARDKFSYNDNDFRHALAEHALAIIDGDLIPRDNIYLFEHGRFNDTPILVGYTSNEVGIPAATSADWLAAKIARLPCKDTHAAIAAAYPYTSDEEAKSATRHIFRDLGVGLSTWQWARLQTAKGRDPAYIYFFDVHGPEHPYGAWHAEEYPYVFGNFPKSPTASQVATSALIRKYWVNFAARGNPNAPGLPLWSAFDERSESAMVFGDSTGSQRLPSMQGIKAWDALSQCAGPESTQKFLFQDLD